MLEKLIFTNAVAKSSHGDVFNKLVVHVWSNSLKKSYKGVKVFEKMQNANLQL